MSPASPGRPPLRVSVVICTADRMETLPHTLEAVRRQTYRPLELVVVVGPGKDAAFDYVRPMSDVKLCKIEQLNLSHSRNVGIAAAAGEIVAFIDDDALPNPRWVEQLVGVYEAEPADCGGVGGVTINERERDRPLQFRHGIIHETSKTEDVREEPGRTNSPNGPWFNRLHGTNMSFRRTALLAAGGFDEGFPYFYEEADTCVRVIKAGFRIVHHGRALVHHFPAVARHRPVYGRFNWPKLYRAATYFRRKHARESAGRCLFRALGHECALFWWFVKRPSALWRSWPEVLHLWWYARGFTAGFLRGWRSFVPAAPTAPPPEFLPLDPAPTPPTVGRAAGEPLNVALLCHSFGSLSNGINVYTLHLAEALTARGHAVTIFRAAGDAPQPGKGLPYRVVDVTTQGRLYQAAVGQQVYVASSYRPFDVVESPLWLGEGCAVGTLVPYPMVARLMTPTEVIRQTSDIPLDAAMHASIVAEKLLINQAAGLIAISAAVAQTVEKVFDVRLAHAARRAAIIPLGLPSAREVKKARIALPTAAPRLLFIGRLEARKGVMELGEAFQRLSELHRTASLWIVGQDNSANDGFRRRTGTNYVEALRALWGPELAKRAHFFGPIGEDEKNYLLSQCDFLVAPSRYESFGLILLEAMRFGKPVVAAAVGGMPEIIEDGRTGLLVPSQAPEELARALERLCGDDVLRRALGRAALERFHQEFEIGKCAERTVHFYREVMEMWRDTLLMSFPAPLRTLATARPPA